MPDSKILAWVEPQGDLHVAAFVAMPVARLRRPAKRTCASPQDAREWVEREADSVGLPVEWVEQAPER